MARKVTRRGPLARWLYDEEMSQQELANLVGVSLLTVNNWVHGRNTDMRLSHFISLVEVTGLDRAELETWFMKEYRARQRERERAA